MTETMLDRVARATETYAVVFTEKALVCKTDTIGARMTKVVGEFDTAQEAKEACKRMNARAVLEVLMEPDEGMLLAGQKPSGAFHIYLTGESMLIRWQAMLTEAMKEGGREVMPVPTQPTRLIRRPR